MQKRNLTEGPLLTGLAYLAAPMLINAILQNIQSLIDLFWVGRLGPHAVAAVATGGTVIMVLFPLLMGLSTGTVALVARAIGGGRHEDAGAAAGQSLTMALMLGGLSGLVGWILAPFLVRLLGAEHDVAGPATEYLRIALLGSFTVFVLFIGSSALQGAGDTVRPMYIMAAANAVNIVLDPLLIFGPGPFPALGVSGAALATVIAQTVAAALVLRILCRAGGHLRVRAADWRPRWLLAWRIARIGIPGAAQMFSRSLMSAVMLRIVATSGGLAVAAYGVGLRLHMIILMPAFALGGAAATIVGQNLGAEKPDRASAGAWLATAVDAAFMAFAAVLVVIFAPVVIRAFSPDPQVVEIGAAYLRTVSPFYVFAALGIVLGRSLNGAGDAMSPMVITVITLWALQVPLAIWFSRMWSVPTQGIWWSIAIAITVQGIITTAWFQTGRWKTREV